MSNVIATGAVLIFRDICSERTCNAMSINLAGVCGLRLTRYALSSANSGLTCLGLPLDECL